MTEFLRTIAFDPYDELLGDLRQGTQRTLLRTRFSFMNDKMLKDALRDLSQAMFQYPGINPEENLAKTSAFFGGCMLAIRALDLSMVTPGISYEDMLSTFCEDPGTPQILRHSEPEFFIRKRVTALSSTAIPDINELRAELVQNFEPEPFSRCDPRRLGKSAELRLCFTAVQMVRVEQTLTEIAAPNFAEELKDILDNPDI
jgi:hypothetical protein